MIKAAIFDRDGVLIDSEWVNIDAATEAFASFDIQITDEDKKEIIGKSPIDYLPYFINKYTFDADKYNKIVPSIYYRLFDKAKIFGDAITLVRWLMKENILRALNTWWYKEGNDILFRRTWLEDNGFHVVVSREDYKHSKPHPESYLVTAQKLWLQPHECVAIEDSDRWMVAAKAAGMKCIIIPNTYTQDQDFSIADIVVVSAKEITIEMIKSLE